MKEDQSERVKTDQRKYCHTGGELGCRSGQQIMGFGKPVEEKDDRIILSVQSYGQRKARNEDMTKGMDLFDGKNIRVISEQENLEHVVP